MKSRKKTITKIDPKNCNAAKKAKLLYNLLDKDINTTKELGILFIDTFLKTCFDGFRDADVWNSGHSKLYFIKEREYWSDVREEFQKLENTKDIGNTEKLNCGVCEMLGDMAPCDGCYLKGN